MMRLLRRVRPFSLALFALLLSGPWQLKLYKAFEIAPSSWLAYGAAVTVAAYWLIAAYYWDFAKERGRASDRVALISIVGAVVVTLSGFLAITFSDTIYTHARFALQREQMERVIDGSSTACPALRCIRNNAEEVAFVWGAWADSWSGVCFDPAGALVEAEAAELEDRFAERPRQARVFGGAVTRANPLVPDWRRCSVSTARLGEPRARP
jgi:hypothetical protein